MAELLRDIDDRRTALAFRRIGRAAHNGTKVQRVALSHPCRVETQVARVAVDDEAWRVFRQAALARGITVAAYLGKLVENELRRRKASPLSLADAERPESDEALALAAVRLAIDDLDDIAGRLARAAVEHGDSWEDVASSLGLSRQAARKAYEKR